MSSEINSEEKEKLENILNNENKEEIEEQKQEEQQEQKEHKEEEEKQQEEKEEEHKENEKTEEEIIKEKKEKKEKRRLCVVSEILSSENTYVNRLRITVDIFIIPLREKNILTNDEFKKQFGNLEIIRELHERLLQALNISTEIHLLQIGKIFKEFSAFLKMYKEYLAFYEGGIVRLAKLVTSNRKFVEFLEKARADPRCLGMGIDSFLMEPVQRIPRYRMLLEELLKYTPEDNEDYPNIAIALENVRVIAIENNTAIREQAGMDQVYQVMRQLDSRYPLNLLENITRKFIRQGDLMKQCRRGRKEFRFWLFNDSILYGESNGLGAYRPSRLIPLTQCRVTSIDENNEPAMRIESPQKSFYVWMKNTEERNSWVEDIHKETKSLVEGKSTGETQEELQVAPVWNPDKAASSCEVCGTSFSFINRKHHCRDCGAVVCDSCSRNKRLIPHLDPNKPQRVCDTCYRKSYPSLPPPPDPTSQYKLSNIGTGNNLSLLTSSKNTRSSSMVFVPPTNKPNMPPPPRPNSERVLNPKEIVQNSETKADPNHSNQNTQNINSPPLMRGHSDGGVYPTHPHETNNNDNNNTHPHVHHNHNHNNTDNNNHNTIDSDTDSEGDIPAVVNSPNNVQQDQRYSKSFSRDQIAALLQQQNPVLLEQNGIDIRQKELSLSDEEFQKLFRCTREEFKSYPEWKKIELRKQNKLF